MFWCFNPFIIKKVSSEIVFAAGAIKTTIINWISSENVLVDRSCICKRKNVPNEVKKVSLKNWSFQKKILKKKLPEEAICI